MRKISKAVLAAGMAAATIASGLSFGAVAANAAPGDDAIVKSQPFEFVTQMDDNTWNAVNGSGKLKSFATRTEATAYAGKFVALPKDGSFTINLASDIDQCLYLTVESYQDLAYAHLIRGGHHTCVVAPGPNVLFKQNEGGNLGGAMVWPGTHQSWLTNNKQTDGFVQLNALVPTAKVWDSVPSDLATPLSGRPTNIDASARTATLVGTAKPGQTIVVNGDENGSVDADTNGDWTYDLTGLKLGNNEITVESFDGAQSTGQITVDVELPVGELTADVEFPANLNDRAVLSGTADKNATINVLHDGTVVGTGMANKTTGDWDIKLDAPNAAGNYAVEVQQVVAGEITTTKTVTVAYGAGVDVDTQDGVEVADGQSLRITGKGEKGASVKVYEAGKPSTILKPGTVSTANGTFGVTVGPLEGREYKLVVEQTGKGNNHTTDTLTVNPGQNDVAAPTAGVNFEADVSKKATVSGTGVNGATINLFEGTTNIGSAPVVNAAWSTEIPALGAGKHTIRAEQSGIEGVQSVETEADFGAAVTAAAPAATTDAKVTLTGTGQNGAKVSAVDATGKQRETTVTGGTWTLEGYFKNGTTPVTVSSVSKGALTTTASVNVTVNQVRKDLVVTTPTKADADNGNIKSGEVTFSGTATPFASVSIDLWAGGRPLATPVTADENGNWTIKGWVGESTYTPIVKQTVLGSTNEITWHTFSTIAYQNLTNVRPTASDWVRPSQTVFSGKGTPGASVSVWTGPKDQSWAREIVKTKVNADGTWSVKGGLSANTTYSLFTYQVNGNKSDMVTNTIATGAEIKDIANVTASNVGTDTTLTGKAQPGATVEFWTGPKDQSWAQKRFVTTANAYGEFTVKAYLSTGNAYSLHGYESWSGSYFGNSTTLNFTPAS